MLWFICGSAFVVDPEPKSTTVPPARLTTSYSRTRSAGLASGSSVLRSRRRLPGSTSAWTVTALAVAASVWLFSASSLQPSGRDQPKLKLQTKQLTVRTEATSTVQSDGLPNDSCPNTPAVTASACPENPPAELARALRLP